MKNVLPCQLGLNIFCVSSFSSRPWPRSPPTFSTSRTWACTSTWRRRLIWPRMFSSHTFQVTPKEPIQERYEKLTLWINYSIYPLKLFLIVLFYYLSHCYLPTFFYYLRAFVVNIIRFNCFIFPFFFFSQFFRQLKGTLCPAPWSTPLTPKNYIPNKVKHIEFV